MNDENGRPSAFDFELAIAGMRDFADKAPGTMLPSAMRRVADWLQAQGIKEAKPDA